MTLIRAFPYCVLLATSLSVGFTAARLSRRTGKGLVWVCLLLGLWTLGLLLLESGSSWAERILPMGVLLAGAFVHAAADVTGWTRPRLVAWAWGSSGVVAATGLLAPRLLYGPGAHGSGPLFLPLAAILLVGTLAMKGHFLQLVRDASNPAERRRRLALFAANAFGALGGGATIALHILNVASVAIAIPFLIVAVWVTSYAVLHSELGADRALVRDAFVNIAVAGTLLGFLLLGYFWWLPIVFPSYSPTSPFGLLIVGALILSTDAVRQFVVDRFFTRNLAVRTLADRAAEMTARAEHLERLAGIGEMASAVAHEVRNPLGVILAEVKWLESSGASEESIAALRKQVARLRHFVDDLLRYARPQPVQLSVVDLSAVVREGIQAATSRGLAIPEERVTISSPQGAGPTIDSDGAALADVVSNLVHNALIAVEAQQEPAHVRVRIENIENRTRVRIVVEDNGPGVPAALEARLFKPFVTGRARDEKHPGTGLGLANCARAVSRLGGTITYERITSGGARFSITLPKTGHGLLVKDDHE